MISMFRCASWWISVCAGGEAGATKHGGREVWHGFQNRLGLRGLKEWLFQQVMDASTAGVERLVIE